MSTTSIYESSEALWLGSLNGLAMIKPGETKIFNTTTGHMNGDHISGITSDINGTVWASIFGGGVFYINVEQQFYGLIQNEHKFDLVDCYDILAINSGRDIIMSCDSMLYTYNVVSDDFNIVEIPSSKELKIRDIVEVYDGVLSIGTWGEGVLLFDIATQNVSWLRGLANKNVNDLVVTSEGTLLITTTTGAFIYDNGRNLVKIPSDDSIWDEDVETILPLGNDEYLLSFITHGLFKYELKSNELYRPLELSPLLELAYTGTVAALSFTQNSKALTVGSFENGVYILPYLSSFVTYFDTTGLIDTNISFLNEVNENILIGDGINLSKVDVRNNRVEPFTDSIGFVYFGLEYKDGFLISTNENGFVILDAEGEITEKNHLVSGLPKNTGQSFSELLKLSEQKILLGSDFGSEEGIFLGNFESGFTKHAEEYTVIDIQQLSASKALILTAFNGVLIYEDTNQELELYLPKNRNFQFDCIERLNAHQFLICVRRNKAQIFDLSTGSYSDFDLDSEDVRNIRTAKLDEFNNLWLASSRGLYVYNMVSEDLIKVTEAEGVFSTEFSSDMSLLLDDGTLILPGNKGVIAIDTTKANEYFKVKKQSVTTSTITRLNYILSDHSEHRPLISEVSNSGLVLPHDNIVLRIQLSHDNLLEAKQLGYETRLVGLSKEWERLDINKHSTSFTTLQPGEYEFQARVVDSRSFAEQPISSIVIQVLPPWWKTTWAYAIYVLLLLTCIYFISWFRSKQLIKLNEELSSKVKERTETISKLLQQKQTFFANVSHEFRTPLALIEGPLDVVAERVQTDEDKRLLSVVRRNTSRLMRLVDQILDLAKFETSKSLPTQVYNLKSTVEVIVASFSGLIERNQQTLLTGELPDINVELIEDSLEMILSNLLSNAIKYSGSGTEIRISFELNNEGLLLKVSDNGKGISQQNQELIFERFTRLDAGENIQGSGIGLALVKQLVTSNGGTIHLESDSLHGAVFNVVLPSSVLSEQEATQVAKPVVQNYVEEFFESQNLDVEHADNKEGSEPGHKPRVLVVEDNSDLRNFIADSLSNEYEIDVAADGDEGLKKAQFHIPDVILSDILMPKMDGYELAHAIRNDEATSHIPVILLTAKGDDLSRMKGWEEKVDDYLTKPFKLKELRLRIERLLSIRDILRKKHTSELSNCLAIKHNEAISFQTKRDKDFFTRFEKVIEAHYHQELFSRAQAASEMAMSERQLNRKLSALIDYNFSEYLRKYRLQKSKALLVSGKQVTEVSYDVGFNSPSYFSSCFKAEFDMTPKAYVEAQESAHDKG